MNKTATPTIKTLTYITREYFDDEIRAVGEPVVLKGLAGHWPAVHKAQQGSPEVFEYLRAMDTGAIQKTLVKKDPALGKFFYSDDLRSQNYDLVEQTISEALESIANPPDSRIRYIQSVLIDRYLRGFTQNNHIDLIEPSIPARAWIGGKTTVQTHFDSNENIAICVLGRREFTLFPPEQLSNLYMGPLETAPGGSYVSMTDMENPDFDKHPRFKSALKARRFAELEPGDAIYIPFGWWHHVKATAETNMLVNYWWSSKSEHPSNPIAVMGHAMMAFHQLPPHQAKVWQNMFEHFVFKANGEPMAHLPELLRGFLGGVPSDERESTIYRLLGVLGSEVGLSPPPHQPSGKIRG